MLDIFPQVQKWVEEDDIIRFPLISLKGWFIAPFTEQSRNDIMTQLSSLHNTYILLSDSADINFLKEQISTYPLQHGFEASAMLLSDEYKVYQSETSNIYYTANDTCDFYFYYGN